MAEVATSPLLLPIATRHPEMSLQKGTSPLEARALESTRLLEEKVQRDMPEIKEMREGLLPHVEINMSEMTEGVVSPEKGEDIPAEVVIDQEGGGKEGHFQKGIDILNHFSERRREPPDDIARMPKVQEQETTNFVGSNKFDYLPADEDEQ
ncbi:unnamed protein product [Timema podura]|uniref:Uncharacterized protein n=1 Tax=Timema podura TaxID=61482 RepID=A0ABN7NN75_TIMPD|nr:unnamed protein product [Timema podura]